MGLMPIDWWKGRCWFLEGWRYPIKDQSRFAGDIYRPIVMKMDGGMEQVRALQHVDHGSQVSSFGIGSGDQVDTASTGHDVGLIVIEIDPPHADVDIGEDGTSGRYFVAEDRVMIPVGRDGRGSSRPIRASVPITAAS